MSAGAAFGAALRRWRQQRRWSQLELALETGSSTRHLSCVETGKAQPSRALVLRLADALDLPLRERNALLLAAGYAPAFPERALGDPALGAARGALQRLLDAHEPNPALAIDRHWNLLAHNRALPALLAGADPALRMPPVNVLRLALHPRGLAPMIANLGGWRAHLLERLRRQAAATGDPALVALRAELQALPRPDGTPYPAPDGADEPPADEIARPLELRTAAGTLRFISTLTVFGGPHDVTLAEIAIESFFPADAGTAERLRTLAQQAVAAA